MAAPGANLHGFHLFPHGLPPGITADHFIAPHNLRLIHYQTGSDFFDEERRGAHHGWNERAGGNVAILHRLIPDAGAAPYAYSGVDPSRYGRVRRNRSSRRAGPRPTYASRFLHRMRHPQPPKTPGNPAARNLVLTTATGLAGSMALRFLRVIAAGGGGMACLFESNWGAAAGPRQFFVAKIDFHAAHQAANTDLQDLFAGMEHFVGLTQNMLNQLNAPPGLINPPFPNATLMEYCPFGNLHEALVRLSDETGPDHHNRVLWELFECLFRMAVGLAFQRRVIDPAYNANPQQPATMEEIGAVDQLHEYVHFDIDPRNIFIGNSGLPNARHDVVPILKLGDFDLTEELIEVSPDGGLQTDNRQNFVWQAAVRRMGKPGLSFFPPEQFSEEWEYWTIPGVHPAQAVAACGGVPAVPGAAPAPAPAPADPNPLAPPMQQPPFPLDMLDQTIDLVAIATQCRDAGYGGNNPPPAVPVIPGCQKVAGKYSWSTNMWCLAYCMFCVITKNNLPDAPEPTAVRFPAASDGSGFAYSFGGYLLNKRNPKFCNVDPVLRHLVMQCLFAHPDDRPSWHTLNAIITTKTQWDYMDYETEACRQWSARVFQAPFATTPLDPQRLDDPGNPWPY